MGLKKAFRAIALSHGLFLLCEFVGFGGFFIYSVQPTRAQMFVVLINFGAVIVGEAALVLPFMYRRLKRGWLLLPDRMTALKQLLTLPLFGTTLSNTVWYVTGSVCLFIQIWLTNLGWVEVLTCSGGYIFVTAAFHFDRMLLWRRILRNRVRVLQEPEDFVGAFRTNFLERLFTSAGFLGFVAITLSFFYALFFIGLTAEQLRVAYTFSIPVIILYPVWVISFMLFRLSPVLEFLKACSEGITVKLKTVRQARKVALRFPYELAGIILFLWIGAGTMFIPLQVVYLDMPIRKAFVLFFGLIPTALGVCLYQVNWHRRIFKPLIVHLSDRYPELLGSVRAPSLRWKLMFSFLTLTVLTVSLAYLASYLQSIRAIDPILLISFFAVLLLVAVGVVINWSRDIARPLVDLAETASEIGTGNLSRRVPIGEEDEIGRLAIAFNRMESDLKEKMESIRILNQELENKVQERTRELQKTLDELRQAQAQVVHSEKMASLGQLVAGVAHEINNPLSFIYSNVKLLDELVQKLKAHPNAPMDTIGRIERLLKGIDDGSDRAKKIVDDLRLFSRLDEAQWKTVDLHEGIESTLNLIHNKLKKKVQIHKEFGALPPVGCYAGELNQVFLNLLVNAMDALSDEGDIWVRTRALDGRVEIDIEDNGAGIAPEVQSKIFEPFYTTKPVGQGTGLGLSISYSIIQKHGGAIRVNSAPGKGTRFTLALPIRSAPPFAP